MTQPLTIAIAEDAAFMPRTSPTRGQAFLGAFMAVLLVGALIASATFTFACAGLSACHSGAPAAHTQMSASQGYGVRS
jgi:hypothetical protein